MKRVREEGEEVEAVKATQGRVWRDVAQLVIFYGFDCYLKMWNFATSLDKAFARWCIIDKHIFVPSLLLTDVIYPAAWDRNADSFVKSSWTLNVEVLKARPQRRIHLLHSRCFKSPHVPIQAWGFTLGLSEPFSILLRMWLIEDGRRLNKYEERRYENHTYREELAKETDEAYHSILSLKWGTKEKDSN